MGFNFRVPVIDKFSPLAYSIALHFHYVKLPHRGAETLHRASLQHVKIMGSRQIFKAIGKDCVYCAKLRKQFLDQSMGPLGDRQLTISPLFYFCMLDLWGPLPSFVPGYSKNTRFGVKPHDVYMMVFVCCVTGCVNVQAIEGKSTDSILQGFNRFFSEASVPKICYPDKDGGLVKALSEGEIDTVDLTGSLSRQRGIKFVTVVPQGHSAHGRAEKKIHMLQESLVKSQMRNSSCTTSGWQTVAKLIEHEVNSVPIGYYHHQTGADSSLLRILTPNSLKLTTMSDRAPAGLFSIPDTPMDILDNIDAKYTTWYHLWNTDYVPLLLDRQKWHLSIENLKTNDVVYFKLTESEMSSKWRFGIVEKVEMGRDGCVRVVTVAYKDFSSDDSHFWSTRTVERPIRNMVKLFHLEDTCLMDDLNSVYNMAKEILDADKISYSEEDSSIKVPVQDVPGEFTRTNDVKAVPKSSRKKKRNEVENLEISMKGWN